MGISHYERLTERRAMPVAGVVVIVRYVPQFMAH